MKSGTVLDNGYIVVASTNTTVLAYNSNKKNSSYAIFKRSGNDVHKKPLATCRNEDEILEEFVSLSLDLKL